MTGARRGPGRSEAARVAILESTARLVADRGYEALTIEGIAADAGVGKQTIYRWWGSKAALVADCLFEGRLLPAQLLPPDTGDLRADLVTWLETVLAHVAAPDTATLFRSLAAAAAVDASIGHALGETLAAGETLVGRLERAIDAGELPPETSPTLVVDALVGVVILRVITRGPVPPGLPAQLVAAVLPRP